MMERLKRRLGFFAPTKKENFLSELYGFEDLKNLFWLSIQSGKPTHTLMVGSVGTGKSTVLESLRHYLPNSVMTMGTQSTKGGIADLFFDTPGIKYLFIDELDKMEKKHQAILLNAMQTGEVIETMKTRKRRIVVNITVFGAANDESKIIEPLLDRFKPIIYVPEYTKAEYIMVGTMVLTKNEGIKDPEQARLITEAVHDRFKTYSMRTLVKIARMTKDKPEDLPNVIDTMLKFDKRLEE